MKTKTRNIVTNFVMVLVALSVVFLFMGAEESEEGGGGCNCDSCDCGSCTDCGSEEEEGSPSSEKGAESPPPADYGQTPANSCNEGEESECLTSGVGICGVVKQTCTNGQWSACDYGGVPNYESPETSCDGTDNDCDGITDEGC